MHDLPGLRLFVPYCLIVECVICNSLTLFRHQLGKIPSAASLAEAREVRSQPLSYEAGKDIGMWPPIIFFPSCGLLD